MHAVRVTGTGPPGAGPPLAKRTAPGEPVAPGRGSGGRRGGRPGSPGGRVPRLDPCPGPVPSSTRRNLTRLHPRPVLAPLRGRAPPAAGAHPTSALAAAARRGREMRAQPRAAAGLKPPRPGLLLPRSGLSVTFFEWLLCPLPFHPTPQGLKPGGRVRAADRLLARPGPREGISPPTVPPGTPAPSLSGNATGSLETIVVHKKPAQLGWRFVRSTKRLVRRALRASTTPIQVNPSRRPSIWRNYGGAARQAGVRPCPVARPVDAGPTQVSQ